MVAVGSVSEPLRGVECYPERWLSSGDAYEFSNKPTLEPPAELLLDFAQIVGNIGILGLYFAGGITGDFLLEWTEGRRNLTRSITPEEGIKGGHIQTAWMPGDKEPVKMVCAIWCDTRVAKGGGKYHKVTKSYLDQQILCLIAERVTVLLSCHCHIRGCLSVQRIKVPRNVDPVLGSPGALSYPYHTSI
jgi:hypothetical protein